MPTTTHVKSGHALKVFDKMPQAPRHFLEWPILLDKCLFGCTRWWRGLFVKSTNLLVQVLQNFKSGQEVNGIIS